MLQFISQNCNKLLYKTKLSNKKTISYSSLVIVRRYLLIHTTYIKGESSVCCNANFPQWWHWCSFSPVWILWWILSRQDETKALQHLSELHGFSPVWICWWILHWLDELKDFLQCPQLYGFSPVWMHWWLFRQYKYMKDFPHWSQLDGFSLLFTVWCFSKLFKNINILSHWCRPFGFFLPLSTLDILET